MTSQRHEGARRWFGPGSWYLAVTFLSVGIFAAIPFWHAANRLGDRSARLWALAFSGWAVAFVVATNLLSDDQPGKSPGDGPEWLNNMLAIVVVVLLVVACVRLQQLRRRVYGHELAMRGADAVMAQALERRRRREEARSLLARDPALARELGIGRPDLHRGYDDGGLIDVNTAPSDVIAAGLEVDAATADAIVAARSLRGGFYSVDEVVVYTSLPPHVQERLREKGIA
ncbi:hypothetical protein [Geodermatophilus sp. FMUSA9-8]|uniref:hypothetical protein n=1 Tax=Geodermatophilus sp. FMUSA9-8 TaxID=3120155 RepID=UPI003008EC59